MTGLTEKNRNMEGQGVLGMARLGPLHGEKTEGRPCRVTEVKWFRAWALEV